MSMTVTQAKVLQETHDTVVALKATVEERCHTCLNQLDDLTEFVNGNGKTGAKSRLSALEKQAKDFKSQRRAVWAMTFGVLALVGEGIINWIR